MGEGHLIGKTSQPGMENNVCVLNGNQPREDFPFGHSRNESPQARRGTLNYLSLNVKTFMKGRESGRRVP